MVFMDQIDVQTTDIVTDLHCALVAPVLLGVTDRVPQMARKPLVEPLLLQWLTGI